MKSLSVRPFILCVHTVTSTRPQPKQMSGWCPCSSASSPTLLTNPKASRKFLNLKTFLRWCSSTTSHSLTLRPSASSSSPLSGGVPPLHGTHVLLASSVISLSLLRLLFVLLEEVGVLGDVALHLVGNLVVGVDSLHRALGLAGPAVDTFVGVDQELVPAVVDAVYRTHLDAALVLRADAGLGYNVGHMDPPSRMPRSFTALYSRLPCMSRAADDIRL